MSLSRAQHPASGSVYRSEPLIFISSSSPVWACSAAPHARLLRVVRSALLVGPASRPLFLFLSPGDAGYCWPHKGLTRPPAPYWSICPRMPAMAKRQQCSKRGDAWCLSYLSLCLRRHCLVRKGRNHHNQLCVCVCGGGGCWPFQRAIFYPHWQPFRNHLPFICNTRLEAPVKQSSSSIHPSTIRAGVNVSHWVCVELPFHTLLWHLYKVFSELE